MEVINEVVEEVKAGAKYKCPKTGSMIPHPFEVILIISGLKFAKQAGTTRLINHMGRAKALYPNLIAGYDLVNEEDFTDDIYCFRGQIL